MTGEILNRGAWLSTCRHATVEAMELADLFEGSLAAHMSVAVDWCRLQRVTSLADIVEAGMSEDFAHAILNAGRQATALNRSLLLKRLDTLQAGLTAKRARIVAAISTSTSVGEGAGGEASTAASAQVLRAEPGAAAADRVQLSGLAAEGILAAEQRPHKPFTAVCGVSARRVGAGAGADRLVCDKARRIGPSLPSPAVPRPPFPINLVAPARHVHPHPLHSIPATRLQPILS